MVGQIVYQSISGYIRKITHCIWAYGVKQSNIRLGHSRRYKVAQCAASCRIKLHYYNFDMKIVRSTFNKRTSNMW